jgi:hypothetical protein
MILRSTWTPHRMCATTCIGATLFSTNDKNYIQEGLVHHLSASSPLIRHAVEHSTMSRGTGAALRLFMQTLCITGGSFVLKEKRRYVTTQLYRRCCLERASEVSKHHDCLGRPMLAISPTEGICFTSSRKRIHSKRTICPTTEVALPSDCRI